MSFKYIPSYRMIDFGENRPVKDELNGDVSLHVFIPDGTAVIFLVREKDEFAGHKVDIIRHSSRWVVSTTTGGRHKIVNEDDEREWIPEPEIGKQVAAFVQGMSEGHATGNPSASMLFDLFLQLEVELAEPESWLEEYFPALFKTYVQKLAKAKEKKVEEVMES